MLRNRPAHAAAFLGVAGRRHRRRHQPSRGDARTRDDITHWTS